MSISAEIIKCNAATELVNSIQNGAVLRVVIYQVGFGDSHDKPLWLDTILTEQADDTCRQTGFELQCQKY